jgi:hypothetical protein
VFIRVEFHRHELRLQRAVYARLIEHGVFELQARRARGRPEMNQHESSRLCSRSLRTLKIVLPLNATRFSATAECYWLCGHESACRSDVKRGWHHAQKQDEIRPVARHEPSLVVDLLASAAKPARERTAPVFGYRLVKQATCRKI